jgi:hypothetical protein
MTTAAGPLLSGAIITQPLAVAWWNRLEPRPRSPEVQQTVAAKVRDPLWFLTRQWQFGEFQGEDAASPAWIQMRARTAPFTGWRPRAQVGVAPGPMQPLDRPLEELVETEGFTPDLSLQVEFGVLFGAMLTDRGLSFAQRDGVLAEVRQDFPLDVSAVDPADATAARFIEVSAGRAVNGAGLARTGATPALLARPAVAPFAAKVQAAVAELTALVSATLGAVGDDSGTAWVTDHLEYQVEIEAGHPSGGAVLLSATPDRDATFEWYTMDLRAREQATPEQPDQISEVRASRLPTFVRFRGMPNHRWWDFERGSSDFGSVIPDKRDLAKLLVMDFMLIHGNDYFVVPFDLAVGTVARIDELLVHDVFGGSTLIDRADQAPAPADARWTCFSIAMPEQGGAPADVFVLPPSATTMRLSGEPIEDVRVTRDEQANLVWAIEQLTEGGDGRPWAGRERHVVSTAAEPKEITPMTAAPLLYRLQSFVPWHWFPMLPVRLSEVTGEIVLERGQMVRPDGATSPVPIGRLLQSVGLDPYRVREEAVPRTGLKVTREVVRSRWVGGETYLWIARRKTAGRGEGASGLRYDEAQATPKHP